MPRIRRLIIVRQGDQRSFDCLRQRFPDAIIIFDRRVSLRASNADPRDRDRRTPQGDIISARGFYMSRQRCSD